MAPSTRLSPITPAPYHESVASFATSKRLYALGHPRALFYKKKSSLGGFGLFARKDIPRNTPITYFDGDMIDHQEAMRRKEKNKASHIITLSHRFAYLDGPTGATIKKGQGAASVMNDGSYAYNCKITPLTMRSNPLRVMRVKTIRDVKKDEELTVTYGKGYWVHQVTVDQNHPEDLFDSLFGEVIKQDPHSTVDLSRVSDSDKSFIMGMAWKWHPKNIFSAIQSILTHTVGARLVPLCKDQFTIHFEEEDTSSESIGSRSESIGSRSESIGTRSESIGTRSESIGSRSESMEDSRSDSGEIEDTVSGGSVSDSDEPSPKRRRITRATKVSYKDLGFERIANPCPDLDGHVYRLTKPISEELLQKISYWMPSRRHREIFLTQKLISFRDLSSIKAHFSAIVL